MALRAIDYDHALLSQGGCNLSGLVHTLGGDLRLRIATEEGDPWNHPITVLYMEQLEFLAYRQGCEVEVTAIASQGGTEAFPEELCDRILAYQPGDFAAGMAFLLEVVKAVNSCYSFSTGDRNKHPASSLIIGRMRERVTASWYEAYKICEERTEQTLHQQLEKLEEA
jgi:hypothetical protein